MLVTILRSSWIGQYGLPGAWQVAQLAPVALFLATAVVLRPTVVPLAREGRLFQYSVGAFMAVALVSSILGIAPRQSLMQWVIAVMMLVALAWNARVRWARDAATVRSDLVALATVFSLVHLAGLLTWFAAPEKVTGLYERHTGYFSNANYTGMTAAVVILLLTGFAYGSAERRDRIVAGSLCIAPALALILSGSRAAMIATAIGLLVLTWFASKRRAVRWLGSLAAVAVIVAIVLFPAQELRDRRAGVEPVPTPTTSAPSTPGSEAPGVVEDAFDAVDEKSSGRLTVYKTAVVEWRGSPLLGTGYRTAELVLDGVETHNLALQVLLETGLFGLGAFGGAITAVGLRLRAALRPHGVVVACVAAVATLEMSESSMFGWGAPAALLFWSIVFALFHAAPWGLREDGKAVAQV